MTSIYKHAPCKATHTSGLTKKLGFFVWARCVHRCRGICSPTVPSQPPFTPITPTCFFVFSCVCVFFVNRGISQTGRSGSGNGGARVAPVQPRRPQPGKEPVRFHQLRRAAVCGKIMSPSSKQHDGAIVCTGMRKYLSPSRVVISKQNIPKI